MRLTLAEWQQTFKDISGLIVQASAVDGSDSWQPFPIGMCWQYLLHYRKGPALQIGNHENLLFCAITATTDRRRRPAGGICRPRIIQTLAANGFQNTVLLSELYFTSLPSYKFVASPEGNGIDCHRHYEALLAGCIPIMERNPLTEEKYKGCPVLWTTDYSEITPSYLEAKYKEMIGQTYDFSGLMLGHYPLTLQRKIKECGNYWCQKIPETRRAWYM